ncbi:MAG: DUF805 domain-containing protein [Caldisericia bacterium]|nr:DUF805 domain-containing protein [Caldisericia bacterium]
MKWFVEGLYWYLDGWKNYANFKGRSRRKAYWYFILFHVFLLVVTDLIAYSFFKNIITVTISILYLVTSLLPWLAVTVRRLQDTDHEWVWILLPGIILWIFRLDLLLQDSQLEDNKYGPDPKKDERFNAYDSDSFQQAK